MDKLLSVLLLAVTLSVTSCGGGSTDVGGTSGTGISYGSVTQFGSIYVNGVKFNTDNASFTVDDQGGRSQSDLKLGMVVAVQGAINGNTGTATKVIAEDVLKGPVEAKNTAGNILTVLGQTVHINDNTLFDNNVPNIDGIQVNDLIEISGHVKTDGTIVATFIEKKTSIPVYEVKGFVKSYSPGTFTIGSLTVNYDASTITADMPAGSWDTLFVEVKGGSASYSATTLTASKVEPEGMVTSATANKAEIEAYVTSIPDITSFKMGSITVQHNNSTVFKGGLLGDIDVSSKIEVEGSLSNNVLTASSVSFRDNIKIEADVAAVDVGNNSFTLKVLEGITIKVDGLTEYKGNYSALSDLAANDHLIIRGQERTGNTVIASRIISRSASTRVILQAPVDNFATPNVTLLGQTLDTSPITTGNFKDVSDNIISSEAFFTSLSNGTLVKLRGDTQSGPLVLDQAEFEE